jgi:predicted signal transduction protein with EAL and GGDEF domain
VREIDTAARFGGDEFSVIVTDIQEPADAAVLATKLVKAFREPFVIEGNEIRSGTSVGIAVYGPDSADAETLLSRADVALYRAKAEGRGNYRFFTDSMDTEVRTRVTMGWSSGMPSLRASSFSCTNPRSISTLAASLDSKPWCAGSIRS